MTAPVQNNMEAGESRWRQFGPVGILGVLWTLAPAIAGTILLVRVESVSDWLISLGALGPLVYIAIFVVSGGCGFLPTYAQAIVGGWVFGPAVGIPAALAGFTGASMLGYLIARFVASDRIEHVIESNRKARVIHEALVGHGAWRTFGVVTLLRLPPNSPFALTNLMMASAGVATIPYLLGTMIGMLPRTAVAVVFASMAANQGRNIVDAMKQNPAMFMLGLVVMVVVLMVIGSIAKRALARLEGGSNDAVAPQ